MMQTSIESLAAWTLSNQPVQRSELARRQAKFLVLDTLGAALASVGFETIHSVQAMVTSLGGLPDCTIAGLGMKSSVLNAVFANGALVRALDLNDVQWMPKEGHLSVAGHCSDNIPVALSVGEWQGSSGAEVLDAIVLGYEMFGRLRDVMPFDIPWDGTSASGLVAAAMAGRLMGLDAPRQANALALAAIRCATPKVVRWGKLSAAKNLANSMIAQSGVMAALLAREGISGPLEVLDHKGGTHQVFDPKLDFSTLWRDSRDPLYIMASNIKSYPCIGTAQTLIVAALDGHRRLAGRVEQIESVEVEMADLPMVRNQQAEIARKYPKTREAADHSFTFLPAIVLLDGKLTLDQYDGERWTAPDVCRLMDKVTLLVSKDAANAAPDSMPCRLRVRLVGGETIATECLYPPGHSFPGRGLDESVVEQKFREFSKKVLSPAQQDKAIAEVLAIERATDIRRLMSLVSGAA